MNHKHLAAFALALTGALTTGAAHARDPVQVQWSVTIGNPHLGVVIGGPAYPAQPAYHAYPAYPVHPGHNPYSHSYGPPARVFIDPRHGTAHARHGRGTGWHDADRDGIPNRYDRVYNPRWDRDGDGVPNRYDRHDGRRADGWGDPRGEGRHGPRSGR